MRVQFPGNKRSVLRVNEAYEHEAILPREPEETTPSNACHKTVTQCVDISAPVILQPTVRLDTVTAACQGAHRVSCVSVPSGTCATVTLTQQVCVTLPIRYSISMSSSEPTITCAEGGSCPSCGGKA